MARALFTILACMLGTAGGISVSSAAEAYNGLWIVSLTTEIGTCPSSPTIVVSVINGAVQTVGFGQSTGHISPQGTVILRVTNGTSVLTARGAVKASAGTGTWRVPSQQCIGRWTAARTITSTAATSTPQ